jgi:cytochrome c oxidase subunit 3
MRAKIYMARIVSDRATKTDQVVVLPSSLEDPTKAPPGAYRILIWTVCASISAFFAALVIAYIWRSGMASYWQQFRLPRVLWLSTSLILISSVTLETARRVFRRGLWRTADRLLLATATLGLSFLAAQLVAWRDLLEQGAYLMENPHSAFFYLFTGLHAAHLIGGLIALFVVVFGRKKRRELVDVVAYYWHFLTVLWLVLFGVLRTVS